ncbi:MAG: NAD-dependent epimerase/dehydratase family protein [Brevundimonas sp.]|nr:NAD-dependent epimerase/dehydratase family protein [Brevundimonas sp.]MDZ4060946.1 NAD-dependent epimerase/dehydratase family protein [Brevundimonas sp.]
MRILVTGGLGFIGVKLARRLADAGHEVALFDSLTAQVHGPLPQLPSRDLEDFEIVRADIRDADALTAQVRTADAVVHLAAETGTGQSMYRIAHYYDVNVRATAMLLEALAATGPEAKSLVIASSRSIYGEGAYTTPDGRLVVPDPRRVEDLAAGRFESVGPGGERLELRATPEEAPTKPASMYAATKLAMEEMCRVFSDSYGARVAALRFQNVYGAGQSLTNPYTGVLSTFSTRMRLGKPIDLFEDGEVSRDFVHVDDVTRSIELALQAGIKGYRAFNVGSGEATPIRRMAELMKQILGSSSEVAVTGNFRAGDIRHCYADVSRVREELGFEPAISLEDGLRGFCDWALTLAVPDDRSEAAMAELNARALGGGR